MFQARKEDSFELRRQVGTAFPADWMRPARLDFTIGKRLVKNQAGSHEGAYAATRSFVLRGNQFTLTRNRQPADWEFVGHRER